MKIAVTYENGQVFQHFGHTQAFKIYEVENQAVTSAEVVPTMGSGHGALAGFLKAQGVDVLICGGIGGGAQTALKEAGIQLFGGTSGNADEQVDRYLKVTLQFQPDITCHHHEHHHGENGNCAHGNCAHGSCGSQK